MDDYKVIWSAKSLNDLDRSHDFLAKKSISAANKIVETILGRVTQLEKLPKSGTIEPRLLHLKKEHRYLVSGHHKIVYRLDKQSVLIVRVFDTRQHPDKMKA